MFLALSFFTTQIHHFKFVCAKVITGIHFMLVHVHLLPFFNTCMHMYVRVLNLK